jgi:hypothetical protein
MISQEKPHLIPFLLMTFSSLGLKCCLIYLKLNFKDITIVQTNLKTAKLFKVKY